MINKKDFYEKLKPFAKNKYSQILLNFRFGHYELIFDWTMYKPKCEPYGRKEVCCTGFIF